MKYSYTIGIDEVGRGPLAGPVAVCAFLLPRGFNTKQFGVRRDSKKLSGEQREQIFSALQKLKKEKKIDYAVCFQSARTIDNRGIAVAIRQAILQGLNRLNVKPEECQVLLDGGLKAPSIFPRQRTIIKGDEKEWAIALASIAAKVTRDRHMVKLAKKYSQYGFDVHKGYGTKKHRDMIGKHGLCNEHRRSFCRAFV